MEENILNDSTTPNEESVEVQTGEEIKENLEQAEETEEERVQRLIAEEKELVKRAEKTSQFPTEDMPPMYKEDQYGNTMPFVLINGEYLPKPDADVLIQEKKVVVEYQRLEYLKNQKKQYHRLGKESQSKSNN